MSPGDRGIPGREAEEMPPSVIPIPGREEEFSPDLDGQLDPHAGEIPELHEVGCPPELRERIEDAMSKYPRIRSASIPALWAVQRYYGWCTPEGIRQAAAVMGVTPLVARALLTPLVDDERRRRRERHARLESRAHARGTASVDAVGS